MLSQLEAGQIASEHHPQLIRGAEQTGGPVGIGRGQGAAGELDRPAGVVAIVRRRRDREALLREPARIFEPAALERHRGACGE